MTEQELRALVRDAIAQHLGGAGHAPPPAVGSTVVGSGQVLVDAAAPSRHPSHLLLTLSVGDESPGPCVIEPGLPCNHCGYCKSYGH